MDINITFSNEQDLAFIYSSWLKSYRKSPHTRKWSDEAYYAYQRPKIDSIIGRSQLLIARPADWADGILGWLCYEQTLSRYYLHYVYVKSVYRRTGVAGRLILHSNPQNTKYFTHLQQPYVGYLPAEYSLLRIHL